MATLTYIKNVAIIGASGNLGSRILESLISANRFNITAITRESSAASFPANGSITVKKGDYDSPSFLKSALDGQDALLLVLPVSALVQPQMKIIDAAAAAGVKWILPTEYGTDSANEAITSAVPINSLKVPARLHLEELTKTHQGLKWIGVVTSLWFDYSLTAGFLNINVPARTAVLLDDGVGKFNTTTRNTVALAVARLLSLPEESPSGSSLSAFANGFCYVSSFLTSQKEILEAVQRVTGTADADWKIEKLDADGYMGEGKAMLARGEMMGIVKILGGMVFKGGLGGDYESVKGVSNAVLGLPHVTLDDAVKESLGKVAK